MTQNTRQERRLEAAVQAWRGRGYLEWLAWGGAAFALAAGSVADRAAPLALGLLCAAPPGWAAVWAAAGALTGYCLFWRELQCWGWVLGGGLVVIFAGRSRLSRVQPLLIPACAALVTSASGVVFLLAGLDLTPIPVYLLRVALSAGGAGVVGAWRRDRDGVAGWLARGMATFCLGQIMPLRYVNLGYLAAGFLGVRSAFPGAVLAGLGLDLAGVTAAPMAGVLCLSFCLGSVRQRRFWAMPALVYGAMTLFVGKPEVYHLPALLAGGFLGSKLPGWKVTALRPAGVLGAAQVRLERQALVLDTLSRCLEAPAPPEDRRALLGRAASGACDTCPERKGCKARHAVPALSEGILEQPGLGQQDLPPGCRKPARLLEQLRLAQERLRRLRGEHQRQEQYRRAARTHYALAAGRIRAAADGLRRREHEPHPVFRPQITVRGKALAGESGDLCVSFSCGSHAWLLLCDGMGTGREAQRASREAAELLRELLEAGVEEAEALECYNALCDLRGEPAKCTLDLLSMDLERGGCVIYKWGAAPSWLLRGGHAIKVGTAGPPPGVSQEHRAMADRLSLGEEDLLLMLTDGAMPEQWPEPACLEQAGPNELTQTILEHCAGEDDATVAAVRLLRCRPR